MIKDHKADIKKINDETEKNKRRIGELRNTNDDMKEPLRKLRMEKDRLKSLLRQFEKHKMSLQNYKSKLATLREKVVRLEKEFNELCGKHDLVVGEKKDLTGKFENLTKEVKRHAEMYNMVLTKKMEAEIEQL